MSVQNWTTWRLENTHECKDEERSRRILPWHERCIQHELREARRQRWARERFVVPKRKAK